jgi:hypothetical protein
MNRLAGSMISIETPDQVYWSTPVLIDENHGICSFMKAVPPGTHKLKMSILGVNTNVVIPPSQGAPLTLTMKMSPEGISITLSK